jgi:hypothetical protein
VVPGTGVVFLLDTVEIPGVDSVVTLGVVLPCPLGVDSVPFRLVVDWLPLGLLVALGVVLPWPLGVDSLTSGPVVD